MKNPWRIPLIFVLACAILAACETKREPYRIGDEGSSRALLVAAAGSRFKDEVLKLLLEDLKTDRLRVDVRPLEELDGIDAAGYGCILVMSRVTGGVVDPRAAPFLESLAGDPRLVLFLTYGLDVALSEVERPRIELDAVGSASKMARAPERAAALAGLVRRRL